MAKIIITFEDSPDGVIVSAHGAAIPPAEKNQTDAQKLAMLDSGRALRRPPPTHTLTRNPRGTVCRKSTNRSET